MEPNDDRVVIIKSDPVKGESTYQGKSGTEFAFNVVIGGTTQVLMAC